MHYNLIKYQMTQDPQQIYYMVIDEQQAGPFTLDEITLHPKLTPETLVWKPGYDNWMAAKNFPELVVAFTPQRPPQDFNTPPEYRNPQETESNPYTEHNNQNPHINQNPGYGENPGNNRFANNPQYQSNHSYNNGYQEHRYHENRNSYYHNNGFQSGMRTNWLPWAIVATIIGFFTSCIGAIFGIIGIVQANKANNFYAQGYDREGDSANSNARIMTIIGLIFAGIGILILFFFGNFFSNLSNFYYY